MSRRRLERRLSELSTRIRVLRDDLRLTDEQLLQLDAEADDARLRSLVSETPLAGSEHRDAQRHADAMRRHREGVLAEIAELEARQDELLDRLSAQRRPLS